MELENSPEKFELGSEKEVSPVQNAMKWGFYTGVALIGYSLVFYILGSQPQNGWQFLSYFILIFGIFWGTKTYRDEYLDGFVNYGKALGSGVLISLFAAVILAVYTYIFLAFIDPTALEKGLEMAEEQLRQQNMSEQEIEMGMEMARKMNGPGYVVFFTIMIYTFVGFLFSLITSALIKKNRPMFN